MNFANFLQSLECKSIRDENSISIHIENGALHKKGSFPLRISSVNVFTRLCTRNKTMKINYGNWNCRMLKLLYIGTVRTSLL